MKNKFNFWQIGLNDLKFQELSKFKNLCIYAKISVFLWISGPKKFLVWCQFLDWAFFVAFWIRIRKRWTFRLFFWPRRETCDDLKLQLVSKIWPRKIERKKFRRKSDLPWKFRFDSRSQKRMLLVMWRPQIFENFENKEKFSSMSWWDVAGHQTSSLCWSVYFLKLYFSISLFII